MESKEHKKEMYEVELWINWGKGKGRVKLMWNVCEPFRGEAK